MNPLRPAASSLSMYLRTIFDHLDNECNHAAADHVFMYFPYTLDHWSGGQNLHFCFHMYFVWFFYLNFYLYSHFYFNCILIYILICIVICIKICIFPTRLLPGRRGRPPFPPPATFHLYHLDQHHNDHQSSSVIIITVDLALNLKLNPQMIKGFFTIQNHPCCLHSSNYGSW